MIKSKFKPTGDQPQAIAKLVDGINDGVAHQTLLGVTGSGKTFTVANAIEQLKRPALVIAHNKTLAAQLCEEFREFFPDNRVEFFVSYYDYYQPESYIVATDTYIEKDSAINEEIDRLRHSATSSLIERKDVIVVASVSCIYGLGAPEEYYKMHISVRKNDKLSREELIKKLVAINYKRNDIELNRTNFRVRGDIVDVYPANLMGKVVRIEFFGNKVERIVELSSPAMTAIRQLEHIAIMPASHFVQSGDNLEKVLKQIEEDLEIRLKELGDAGKMLEQHRLKQRTTYDIEMMRQIGTCKGIENYSRYFDGRPAGSAPFTLLDYFPKDFIMFVDESHITMPQIRGMYEGDKARKNNLIDYGFRLPSARDNRPLKFEEFKKKQPQTIYISATPAKYETELSKNEIVEQIIRPTGLIDPPVFIVPTKGQMEHLLTQIRESVKKGGRTLITVLTKKMAEILSTYLLENKIKAKYMHSDIETLERIKIVTALRNGEFDVIVGINLLREGLDLPEVNLVAILDADKEGLFRSRTSLIQTIGRAARNIDSKVILYADKVTLSMQQAIDETNRRRAIQVEYNNKHGIIPKTITKEIKNSLKISVDTVDESKKMTKQEKASLIEQLTIQMQQASKDLDFELAIAIREQLKKIK